MENFDQDVALTNRLSVWSLIAYDCYKKGCPKNSLAKLTTIYPGMGFEDYELIETHDSMAMCIANHKLKILVFAFKGTNTDCIRDIISDLSIIFKNRPNSKDLKQILEWVKSVIPRFEGYQIQLTGHSLGGTMAESIAKSVPFDVCETFNSGVKPLGGWNDYKELHKNIKVHRTKDDPLVRTKSYHDPDFTRYTTIWYDKGGHMM